MRSLIYPLIAVAIILACSFQAKKPVFEQPELESPKIQVIDRKTVDEVDLSPWVMQGSDVTLVAAQGAAIAGWEDDKSDERIASLEAAVKDLMTVKASSFDFETRLDTLETQMAEAKSDIVDLSNGQADLTKRVEELTALIEKRCPDGTVKTAAVKLNALGTGEFNLAPGEVLLSVDGVAVAPKAFSGGSNGSTVATTSTTTTSTNYGSYPPAAPMSGGSNGSLQYRAQVQNYQTSTYDVQTTPTPTTTNVQVQRRPLQQLRTNAPLRSRLAPKSPQSAPPVCFGPNCPN